MKSVGLPNLVLFLIVWAVVAASASFKNQLDWLAWKVKYNKIYETEEAEVVHRQTWQRNKAYVEQHNRRQDVTFNMEMNEFADQEVPRRKKLFYPESCKTEKAKSSTLPLKFKPSSWDWRDHGDVGPVKTQGMISDSIAIVAAECVESYYAIHSQVLTDLSVAEVFDCCTHAPVVKPGVFKCIHDIGGLCSTSAYPLVKGQCKNDTCPAIAQALDWLLLPIACAMYIGKDKTWRKLYPDRFGAKMMHGVDKYAQCKDVFFIHVDGGNQVTKGDENQLVDAVLQTPVMATIDAGLKSFQFYTNGIYSDPQCSPTKLNHAVQIVGYGSKNGTDYWICRNSWGTNWGMRGYILIARNQGNMCGIASMAFYPV